MGFYTYLWLRLDGTPYYVGKGSGRRAFTSDDHKIHRPASRDRIQIILARDEQSALETEKFLIAYYGRKDLGTGCLRNLTDGGEGVTGWRPSEYTRRKMSETHKRRPRPRMSEETKRKIGDTKMGKPWSPARRAKGNGLLGHKHSPEVKAKIAATNRVTKAKRRLQNALSGDLPNAEI